MWIMDPPPPFRPEVETSPPRRGGDCKLPVFSIQKLQSIPLVKLRLNFFNYNWFFNPLKAIHNSTSFTGSMHGSYCYARFIDKRHGMDQVLVNEQSDCNAYRFRSFPR